MPVIYVHGIPPEATREHLEKLLGDLRQAVASVEELQITPGQVTVFFPADRVQKGLGEEIILQIEGLYERPERTPEVLNRLAAACARVTRAYFYAALIEVFVHTVNPVAGAWVIPSPALSPYPAPDCEICRNKMQRMGTCYKCSNCGHTIEL